MERWFPIATTRLLLREFDPSDEADLHEYASDPAVPRYDFWRACTAEETHERLTRHIAEQAQWPRDDVTLAAQLRQEGKVIGSVRLWIGDAENSTAEIGYTFNRRYWNSGYATEAASALLERAFVALKAHRVVATCDTRNTRSWRVMEKIGMRREAHFLRDKLQKGEWRDTFLYAILADEWSAQRST
jgi:[ribosomal protein S5]-alanine N-acetyltransferase